VPYHCDAIAHPLPAQGSDVSEDDEARGTRSEDDRQVDREIDKLVSRKGDGGMTIASTAYDSRRWRPPRHVAIVWTATAAGRRSAALPRGRHRKGVELRCAKWSGHRGAEYLTLFGTQRGWRRPGGSLLDAALRSLEQEVRSWTRTTSFKVRAHRRLDYASSS
jgi:hypothetical protein